MSPEWPEPPDETEVFDLAEPEDTVVETEFEDLLADDFDGDDYAETDEEDTDW